MKQASRKELLRAFRERAEIGGVYAFVNKTSGKRLILSTTNIDKAASQLEFARSTGLCVHPLVEADWKASGGSAFSLEILERLRREETQTDEEFGDDVRALESLWKERFDAKELYR